MKQAHMIIEDCMRSVHPVYNIKSPMIKRELAKDPQMKDENWDRFLPKFKKKNSKRRNTVWKHEKEEYKPFPPLPQPSKADEMLEAGEYFNERG